MSTDPGIWGWTGDIGRLGFTVTFSLGRHPEDVLSQYGVDPSRAQHLTRDQAWASYPPGPGGGQLRAGTLGRWGFCFEEGGTEGITARTLSRLATDTEAISFSTAAGASRFIYLKDGQGIEAFEPGLPETLRGNEPRKFWNDTQRILEWANPAAPMVYAHAVLQVITKHVRGLLDRTALEGPLLTAHLSSVEAVPTGPGERGYGAPVPPPGTASAHRSWSSSPGLNTAPLPIVRLPPPTLTAPTVRPRPTPLSAPGTADSGYDRIHGTARAS